jgi:type IV pilus assembly protein PilO
MAISFSASNFTELKGRIQGQFTNLDTKNPASWPSVPRNSLFCLVTVVVVVVLWFLWLSGSDELLEVERASKKSNCVKVTKAN